MSKTDEYLKQITNYIFCENFTQALLIDGAWGCGKTHFVKNILIKEIEQTPVKNKNNDMSVPTKTDAIKKGKEGYYQAVLVSLYGLATIDDIQNAIFTACLVRLAKENKNKKLQSIIQNVPVFGPTVLSGVGSMLKVGDMISKLSGDICKTILSPKRGRNVLLFDDVERCRVDIIELMGFLNNLCENNGYRIVLIANENEIQKRESTIATAIQTGAALLDLRIKEKWENVDGVNNTRDSTKIDKMSVFTSNLLDIDVKNKSKDSFRNDLEKHRVQLFDSDDLYSRTREKLIGMTVFLNLDMTEVYGDILDTVVRNKEVRAFLIEKKQDIIEKFKQREHNNLRTLKSLFVAVGDIYGCLRVNVDYSDLSSEEFDGLVADEREKILFYIVQTAINIANGERNVNLKGERFGNISGKFINNTSSIVAYAFVNEYWTTLTVDEGVVNRDYTDRIKESIERRIEIIKDSDHRKLALFNLERWYEKPDNDVKAEIRRLKNELIEKKYYAWEFKDIIFLLMRINDDSFGMNTIAIDPSYVTWGTTYDAMDDSIDDLATNQKEAMDSTTHNEPNIFTSWQKENIPEYVHLMEKYFNNEDFVITKEMLRLFFSDARTAIEYREHIKPILKCIDRREKERIKREEIDIFCKWDDSLCKCIAKKRNDYISRNEFISVFGSELILEKLTTATSEEIFVFCDAVYEVYNFSNLGSLFSKDYEDVYRIWNDLKCDRENGRKKYNRNKQRTKEIALRKLEINFELYKDALKDPTI